jgi:hypothetical protein
MPLLAFVVSLVFVAPLWAQTTAKSVPRLTDDQVKEQIVKQSIASYAGSCPCPFNRDRAGRSCGRRSAYSRPGGAALLCYANDVTAKMVADFRAARGEKQGAVAPATRPLVEKS